MCYKYMDQNTGTTKYQCDKLDMTCGVPQDSVLGPDIFL